MAIDAVAALGGDTPVSGAISVRPGNASEFSALLGEGIARVDASLKTADVQLQGLAAGEDIPLHDVMISMERARMDLMLVAEVRNRLVEAYQELTRMQL